MYGGDILGKISCLAAAEKNDLSNSTGALMASLSPSEPLGIDVRTGSLLLV